MKIIDTATLQRLEELEKRATKGPWEEGDCHAAAITGQDGAVVIGVGDDGACGDPDCCGSPTYYTTADDADIALTVESRNALPLLLDSVRRLKEALAIAMAWVDVGGPSEAEQDMARIRELVDE